MAENDSDKRIRFKCRCGKEYTAKGSLAGKTTVCKQCGGNVRIPLTSARGHMPSEIEGPAVKGRAKLTILAGGVLVLLAFAGGGVYIYHSIRTAEVELEEKRIRGLYATFLEDAQVAIQSKKNDHALKNLKDALALPGTFDKSEAQALLKEVETVMAPARKSLQALSDVDLQTLCETRTLPLACRLTMPALNAQYEEKLLAWCDAEEAHREQQRAQDERQAKEEAEVRARAEAARKELEEANWKAIWNDAYNRGFKWGRSCGIRFWRENREPSAEDVNAEAKMGYEVIRNSLHDPRDFPRDAYVQGFERAIVGGFVMGKYYSRRLCDIFEADNGVGYNLLTKEDERAYLLGMKRPF